MSDARFAGTSSYVATEELMMAVNASVTLGRPLLVKGEPGTGKTMLAHEVANSLGRPFIQWHVKSTTKAQQGLYEYDAVARLRDSQLGDGRVHDIGNYIVKGKLWEAFDSDVQPVVLIDEIDCTITRSESGEFISVFNKRDFDCLTNSGVRLFSLNTDFFNDNTFGLSRTRKRVVLCS